MTTDSAELLTRLNAALERAPNINLHRSPIHAHVEDRQLVLEGTVENIAVKKQIVAMARRFAGDTPVLDWLRVRPAEHQEDVALRTAVVESLGHEPALAECGLQVRAYSDGDLRMVRFPRDGNQDLIEVSVHEGVVHLTGRVGSLSHLRLTEVLSWWTTGCEAVENRLQIVPPEVDNDDEITDAVRMILEKDPFLNAGQLSVSTRDRVVMLQGYLASDEARQIAVLDAWYVPGVDEVVDRIEVRR